MPITWCNPEVDQSTNKEVTARETERTSWEPVQYDWELTADLPDWRNYPPMIKRAGLKPDVVLWSETDAKIFIFELTGPYRSRTKAQLQFKLAKYEDLSRQFQ